MKTGPATHTTVAAYIESYPEPQRHILEELRAIITAAAPMAKEVISYKMPAIKQHGILVYYAAYKDHIGFYPTASGVRVFADELTKYKTSKGAIQFPIDKPIPKTLVKKIVKFRMKEDAEKAAAKKHK